MNDIHGHESTPELLAIEAGLDSIGASLRDRPDEGFEHRIASRSDLSTREATMLRIAPAIAERRTAFRTGDLLRIAASVLILGCAIGAIWLAKNSVRTGQDLGGETIATASATDAEITEIADAWDLLDDAELATRLDDLHTRTSSLAETVGDEWLPSAWIGEDSM